MKKTILSSICTILLLGTTALNAEVVKTAKSTIAIDQGVAEAYELLESMHMSETYQQVMDKMLEAQKTMLPPMIKNNAKILKEFNQISTDFMRKYVGWDKVKDDMAKLYAKHYTVSEINDIKNFYLTPTGEKSLNIMPKIAAESMQLTQSKMMPHIKELQDSIMNLMKNVKEKK